MISLIRLESDGRSLQQVAKDLDTAQRQLGPFAEGLHVHDEHYERVHDTCFKGRRVFRVGEKSQSTNFPNPWAYSGTTANYSAQLKNQEAT